VELDDAIGDDGKGKSAPPAKKKALPAGDDDESV
jgi:hypothetical protein